MIKTVPATELTIMSHRAAPRDSNLAAAAGAHGRLCPGVVTQGIEEELVGVRWG